ncbi:MAG TPA: DUF4185 domain-containing protein [Chitinophagaceae bacterium]|nr:DUF4185 domain-containing protein [Chitinophagaceae bacterium]
MKKILSILVLIFLVCQMIVGQDIRTLNPVFTEQTATLINGVEGEWYFKTFDTRMRIKKAGENFYHLDYGSDKNPSVFEAVFSTCDKGLILDLAPFLPDTLGDDFFRESFQRTHNLFKVELKGSRLILSGLNYSWFYQKLTKDKLDIPYQDLDKSIMLEMGTGELAAFLNAHWEDEGIFSKPDSLELISAIGTKYKDHRDSKTSLVNDIDFAQPCLPSFPFKEGWLGADGDVTVTLNDSTTLFIFSDTYIGSQSMVKRGPGMGMVSSTLGVETCKSSGETEIHYFWRDMYTDHPKPVFSSNTSRYAYWVKDALRYNGELYVLLDKVGKKKGAAPDDIFGFTLLGYSLARVLNPMDHPDQWEVDLIPLQGYNYPERSLYSAVIKDGYLYLFGSRKDKQEFLIRKPMDLIKNFFAPFEYFSSDGAWKTGFKDDDVKILFDGFRSTTVKYHPDIKKWIMLIDLAFMTSKIKMRMANELTGPWSDEKTIYEVPELMPGNPLFLKNNFGYLPRECVQNYDRKTKTMLISYDINSGNFDDILKYPAIYTPRLVKVPLTKELLRAK